MFCWVIMFSAWPHLSKSALIQQLPDLQQGIPAALAVVAWLLLWCQCQNWSNPSLWFLAFAAALQSSHNCVCSHRVNRIRGWVQQMAGMHPTATLGCWQGQGTGRTEQLGDKAGLTQLKEALLAVQAQLTAALLPQTVKPSAQVFTKPFLWILSSWCSAKAPEREPWRPSLNATVSISIEWPGGECIWPHLHTHTSLNTPLSWSRHTEPDQLYSSIFAPTSSLYCFLCSSCLQHKLVKTRSQSLFLLLIFGSSGTLIKQSAKHMQLKIVTERPGSFETSPAFDN